jgi:hypothetical protein
LPTNDKNGAPARKRFSRPDKFRKIKTTNLCAVCVARLMRTILLLILILLLIGALPAWPYSTGWGYYPSGGLGLILVILVILAVTGRL